MESIDFPLANVALGKEQPQYKTLYALYEDGTENKAMVFCMELTDEEIAELIQTKRLWVRQTTFGKPFQPINISVDNPYPSCFPDGLTPPADENRTAANVWDKTHFSGESTCMNCGKSIHNHFWSTRQCNL